MNNCDFCNAEFTSLGIHHLSCGECDKSKIHLLTYFEIYFAKSLAQVLNWDTAAQIRYDANEDERIFLKTLFYKNITPELIKDLECFAFDYESHGQPNGEYPSLLQLFEDHRLNRV